MTSCDNIQTPRSSPGSRALDSILRRDSTQSTGSPVLTSPRVQLVPHARHPSYESALSSSDNELIASTNFSTRDVASKDFDFEDVFTYDKPQQKLKRVVEVSSPAREWGSFSFSHYQAAVSLRNKVNKPRTKAAEMYVRNQDDARKR